MEDWKKKYEELFGHVQDFHKRFSDQCSIKKEIEECIPELAESEDERIRKELVAYIKTHPAAPEGHIEQSVLSSWLAYLEKQKEQKPAEWSEEDEKFIKELCNLLASIAKNNYVGRYYAPDLVNKLQSLRPQPHWKPSEEQMKFLKRTVNGYDISCRGQVALESLYNGLQKLM